MKSSMVDNSSQCPIFNHRDTRNNSWNTTFKKWIKYTGVAFALLCVAYYWSQIWKWRREPSIREIHFQRISQGLMSNDVKHSLPPASRGRTNNIAHVPQ
jgi:hypothetical protein